MSSFRRVVQGIRDIVGLQKKSELVESREVLSGRYMGELRELLDDGEISLSVAQRVIDDMFEPLQPGAPPRVRMEVWQAYVRERPHCGLSPFQEIVSRELDRSSSPADTCSN